MVEGLVLVAGATGGVGQLAVAQLLAQDYSVRVLTRSAAKAQKLFGDRVAIAEGDIQQPATLPAATEGVSAILCCTGTTAFPSSRWQFEFEQSESGFAQAIGWAKVLFDADYRRQQAQNSPYQVDAIGVSNLVAAAPQSISRFVFVSSCGIERKDQLPFSLLNAFGVLEAKQQGEQAILASGLPYTIIRPARLIDGPYTSYDLNTLLQAKTQGELDVVLGTGDRLNGQTSRIDVAAACVASLQFAAARNQIFEIISQGDRPAQINWQEKFERLSA